MAVLRNPFVPTFGTSPPVLAGRDPVFDDIVDGLETGPGHPEYTVVLTGPRGVGKTVALNEIQRRAQGLGWLVIALDTSSGIFLVELVARCRAILETYAAPPPRRRVKGLRAAGVGIDFEVASDAAPQRDLRELLTTLGGMLRESESGLLITLDELHSAATEELRLFGSVIQHVTKREGHPVAFAAAALPQIEDEVMAGETTTFLQRCAWHELEAIATRQVAEAIRATVVQTGRQITAPAVEFAAEATSGYAFMVQLVGHHMWNAARGGAGPITLEHARLGVAEANTRMGRQVFAPQWKALSDVDRAFLLSMVADTGPSRIADVAQRLGKSPQYVNSYRDRLIRNGWIRASRRGVVELTHHAARQWLRDRQELPAT